MVVVTIGIVRGGETVEQPHAGPGLGHGGWSRRLQHSDLDQQQFFFAACQYFHHNRYLHARLEFASSQDDLLAGAGHGHQWAEQLDDCLFQNTLIRHFVVITKTPAWSSSMLAFLLGCLVSAE
jgi:hypothetical protein